MRFQNIFIIAAATALAYAQLSDVEETASKEVAGIASEVDDVPEVPITNANSTVADANQSDDEADELNNAPLENDDDVENATDAAEGSDDYDDAFATDGAELSDDYEAATAVDDLDAPSAAADEDSETEEPTSNNGAVAAAAGAAAAAAAGVFVWAKKSKKQEVTNDEFRLINTFCEIL